MSQDDAGDALGAALSLLEQSSVPQPSDATPVPRGAASQLRELIEGALAALRRERERAALERAELERNKAELERAVVARDELLAVVGHELRNPISPSFLRVHALLLSARSAPDGKVEASWLVPRLESLERQMQRFLESLDRILDLSRLSAGRIDLQLTEVDLAEVVREVVDRFEHDAVAAHCELRADVAGPIVGHWDRLRLEQIVSNLLSNAVRYGAGHPIAVRASAQGDAALLEVRDHGIGIAAEDQARIFERFERAQPRRAHGGFGVGLWVVKNLCNALGGSIAVDSALASGARFTVTLPRGTKTET